MPQRSEVGTSLGDYFRPIWRFKFLIVLVTVLAAAATYVYVSHESKTYQASTTVYVGRTDLDQLLSPSAANTARLTADQAMLVATPQVAGAVRSQLRLDQTTRELMKQVAVSANSNTDVLTITVHGSNPTTLAEIANGFAQQYLRQRAAQTVGTAAARLTAAQQKLAKLSPNPLNNGIRNGLLREITTLQGILVSPPSPGSQVSPAEVPTVAHSPSPTRDAAFAGAIALVLCLILAYVIDFSDHRLRGASDVEGELGLPVLARLPRARGLVSGNGAARQIPAALAEGLRTLRVNLDLIRAEAATSKPFTVLVTSALAGEGKSTVVSQLALAYRDAGKRVAVVEADLRLPVLAERLGIDPSPGLVEALESDRRRAMAGAPSEEADPDDDALIQGRFPHMQSMPQESGNSSAGDGALEVLVAGNPPADPTALLTGDRIYTVLEQLDATSDYDIVLIDSPAVLGVSDTLPLLGVADAVLIVVRKGTASRSSAASLRGTLERIGASQAVNVVGVVANDLQDKFAADYKRRVRRRAKGGQASANANGNFHS